MLFTTTTFGVLCLMASKAFAAAVTVSASPTVPTNASPQVDKQFLGFGVEAWSFPHYTGNKTNPNQFSLNMLQSITNRTGTLPIRIGGTSRDHAIYDPSQTQAVSYPSGTAAGHNSPSILGSSYLDGFGLVPGASWILDLPLAINNLSNSIEYVRDALKVIPSGALGAIEIGNEVNSYPGTVRPKSYSPQDYVQEWHTWTTAISGNITSLPKEPNFWALSLASGTSPPWEVPNIFNNAGLSKYENMIKAVSQHYYQITSTDSTSLQDTFLNHSQLVAHMNNQFSTPISYLQSSTNPQIPFLLGEVGNGLGSQTPKLKSSLGAAIWTVDFFLYSMMIGVQRVNMQLIDSTAYAAFDAYLGTDAPGSPYGGPAVLANWYAYVLIADIIQAGTGALRVAEIDVTPNGGELSSGSVVAYAAYDHGHFSQVIVLDEQIYDSTSSSPRPRTNVTVEGLNGVSSVKIQRMSGPDSYAVSNVTWAGQSWSPASNGMPVNVKTDTTTKKVSGGSVTLPIDASEVLVLTMQ